MSAIIKASFSGLRRMDEADLDQVMDIELATYEHPWTRGIFLDCLRVGYQCFVYQQQGIIDAYAVMSIGGGEAHVLSLVVRKAVRKHGLGRMLMQHMIDEARGKGCETLFLEVRPSNDSAIHLYHKMGFNEIGMRRGYYPARNGREDALLMAYSI